MEMDGGDLRMVDVPPQVFLSKKPQPATANTSATRLSSTQPGESGIDVVTNGFQTSNRHLPAPHNNGFHANLDPGAKPTVSKPTLPNDGIIQHLSSEHPMADLSDLGDKPARIPEDVDEDEYEQVKPYNSLLPTGYCYDVRMRYHYELEPSKERRELHPEDPRRIFKIYQELCVAGLIKDEQLNREFLIPNPLVRIGARYVSEAEVCLVHDKKMFDKMRETKGE